MCGRRCVSVRACVCVCVRACVRAGRACACTRPASFCVRADACKSARKRTSHGEATLCKQRAHACCLSPQDCHVIACRTRHQHPSAARPTLSGKPLHFGLIPAIALAEGCDTSPSRRVKNVPMEPTRQSTAALAGCAVAHVEHTRPGRDLCRQSVSDAIAVERLVVLRVGCLDQREQ